MSDSPLGTWRHPPLVYVVAELGYSPYYSLGQKIPALQDALRRSFPRTQEGKEPFVEAGKVPGGGAWQFFSEDMSHGIQIGARAVSLHATSYVSSGEFLGRWAELLDVLRSVGFEAFIERAGLRYIDLFIPSVGHTPAEYIVQGLQGVRPEGAESSISVWSGAAKFSTAVLNFRIFAPAPPGLPFPNDFNALPLRKPELLVKAEEVARVQGPLGIIDMDCQKEVGKIFDAASVVGAYRDMHKLTSKHFSGVLSDLARKEWM